MIASQAEDEQFSGLARLACRNWLCVKYAKCQLRRLAACTPVYCTVQVQSRVQQLDPLLLIIITIPLFTTSAAHCLHPHPLPLSNFAVPSLHRFTLAHLRVFAQLPRSLFWSHICLSNRLSPHNCAFLTQHTHDHNLTWHKVTSTTLPQLYRADSASFASNRSLESDRSLPRLSQWLVQLVNFGDAHIPGPSPFVSSLSLWSIPGLSTSFHHHRSFINRIRAPCRPWAYLDSQPSRADKGHTHIHHQQEASANFGRGSLTHGHVVSFCSSR